jgi:hypothetical protein
MFIKSNIQYSHLNMSQKSANNTENISNCCKNTTQILVDQKCSICYNRSIVRNKEQKCR